MSKERIEKLAKEIAAETEATEVEATEYIKKMVACGYGLYGPDFKQKVKTQIQFDKWEVRQS